MEMKDLFQVSHAPSTVLARLVCVIYIAVLFLVPLAFLTDINIVMKLLFVGGH